jgi:hypothetical protein
MEEIVPTQTLLGYNAAGLPLTDDDGLRACRGPFDFTQSASRSLQVSMKSDVLNTPHYDTTRLPLVAIRHRNLAIVSTLVPSQRRNASLDEPMTVMARGKRLPRASRPAHVPLVSPGGFL